MSKILEGENHLVEAAKCLKTGLLKWKPDYDIAGTEYEKAAQCFKSAKSLDRALEIYLKAADAYKKSNQPFAAAKCYEQVSTILYKDLQKAEEAFPYIEKACREFRENGTPDTAALTYDRTAKMIEDKYPEKAALYYKLASETVMLEDKPINACEYMYRSATILTKIKKYKEAINALYSTMDLYKKFGDEISCGKYVIFVVLIHLKQNDVVAATKSYQDGRGFLDDHQYSILSRIIESYDALDYKSIIDSLNNSFMKNLDVEYSKIAKTLVEENKEKLKEYEQKKTKKETTDEDLEEGILL